MIGCTSRQLDRKKLVLHTSLLATTEAVVDESDSKVRGRARSRIRALDGSTSMQPTSGAWINKPLLIDNWTNQH